MRYLILKKSDDSIYNYDTIKFNNLSLLLGHISSSFYQILDELNSSILEQDINYSHVEPHSSTHELNDDIDFKNYDFFSTTEYFNLFDNSEEPKTNPRKNFCKKFILYKVCRIYSLLQGTIYNKEKLQEILVVDDDSWDLYKNFIDEKIKKQTQLISDKKFKIYDSLIKNFFSDEKLKLEKIYDDIHKEIKNRRVIYSSDSEELLESSE